MIYILSRYIETINAFKDVGKYAYHTASGFANAEVGMYYVREILSLIFKSSEIIGILISAFGIATISLAVVITAFELVTNYIHKKKYTF